MYYTVQQPSTSEGITQEVIEPECADALDVDDVLNFIQIGLELKELKPQVSMMDG